MGWASVPNLLPPGGGNLSGALPLSQPQSPQRGCRSRRPPGALLGPGKAAGPGKALSVGRLAGGQQFGGITVFWKCFVRRRRLRPPLRPKLAGHGILLSAESGGGWGGRALSHRGPPSLVSWCSAVQGLALAASPPPRHTQPPPRESAPLLKAQKPASHFLAAPNKSLEPVVQELAPYHSSGLIRRATGSESAGSSCFVTPLASGLLPAQPGAHASPPLRFNSVLPGQAALGQRLQKKPAENSLEAAAGPAVGYSWSLSDRQALWGPRSGAGDRNSVRREGEGEGRGGLMPSGWNTPGGGAPAPVPSVAPQPPTQPHSGPTILHPATGATLF